MLFIDKSCTLGCGVFFFSITDFVKFLFYGHLIALGQGISKLSFYFFMCCIFLEQSVFKVWTELKYLINFQNCYVLLNWQAKNHIFFYIFRISLFFLSSSSVNSQTLDSDYSRKIQQLMKIQKRTVLKYPDPGLLNELE